MKVDRTGWIGIIACLAMIFVYYKFFSPEPLPPQAEEKSPLELIEKGKGENPSKPGSGDSEAGDNGASAVAGVAEDEPEQLVKLSSKEVDFLLTTKGGGISTAVLKHHYLSVEDRDAAQALADGKEVEELDGVPLGDPEAHIVLNKRVDGKQIAIGALARQDSRVQIRPDEFEEDTYTIKSQDEGSVVFEKLRDDGLRVTKTYHLNNDNEHQDGHSIVLEVEVANEGAEPVYLDEYAVYGGSSTPFDPTRGYLSGFYWQNKGSSYYKASTWFNGMWIFTPPKDEKVEKLTNFDWAGVSSQFFATIVRPTTQQQSTTWFSPFKTEAIVDPEHKSKDLNGVEFAVALPAQKIAKGDPPIRQVYEIYMGPKEWERIKDLPAQQSRIMAYNKIPIMGFFFGWIIKPCSEWLVWIMEKIHDVTGDYGIAIILLTIFLRICMWPLHAKAHTTSKRMAALTPKINALKEKYPDDPQKMQQEQMKLWKDYGVNPMGGCLPALVQIPVFLGYFRMLQSSAEIRHQPFLGTWIQDLSMPDYVASLPDWLGGFPIHILPFVMTVTSYAQFSMMPKTGDPTQRMLFKLFPLMFFFILYNFASGLALYWTFQNMISVGQTWLLNKKAPPELKKRKRSNKKGFLERIQAQAEVAQKAQAAKKRGESAPAKSLAGGEPTNYGDKGPRKQKPKSKRGNQGNNRNRNRNKKRKRK